MEIQQYTFKVPIHSINIPLLLQIHPVIVMFCLLMLIVIVAVAIYQDPFTNGFGMAVFILGIPMYFVGKMAKKSSGMNDAMGKLVRY